MRVLNSVLQKKVEKFNMKKNKFTKLFVNIHLEKNNLV